MAARGGALELNVARIGPSERRRGDSACASRGPGLDGEARGISVRLDNGSPYARRRRVVEERQRYIRLGGHPQCEFKATDPNA